MKTESLTQAAVRPIAFGKYQLFAALGGGGMSDVFLAVASGQMGFSKLTVVKRLRPALARDAMQVAMFLDEARLAARLNHPNVVQTYEVGEDRGSYFIAMEYLDGQSLSSIMKDETASKVLKIPEIVRIISDALAGLHYAHELRDYDGKPLEVVHRDVSPQNIFVTYEGQIKLVDFGIAKGAFRLTQTDSGILKGKMTYMSPEQAGGGPVDRRTDVFAMGIVLWEAICKCRLITGAAFIEQIHELLSRPLPRASSVIEGLDPKLDDIIATALEADVERRFQTAQEMRDALENWLKDSGHHVRQEVIGRAISSAFMGVQQRLKEQIQLHMTQLQSSAGQESGQLRRADATAELPLIGVDTVSTTSFQSLPVQFVRQKLGRAYTISLLVAGIFAVGSLIFFFTRNKENPSATSTKPSTAQSTPTAGTGSQASVPSLATAPAIVPPATPSGPESTDGTRVAKPSAAPKPPLAQPIRAKPASTARDKAPPPAAQTTTVAPGYLTLDTYPWSTVSEGGRVLGTTPLIRVPLSPGEHSLLLENPEQGIKRSYSVTIRSGESETRKLGLK